MVYIIGIYLLHYWYISINSAALLVYSAALLVYINSATLLVYNSAALLVYAPHNSNYANPFYNG